jgi:hypothetical protein
VVQFCTLHNTTFYLATSNTTVVWIWELQHYGHKSIMTAGSVKHGLNLLTESFYKNKRIQKTDGTENSK